MAMRRVKQLISIGDETEYIDKETIWQQ